MSDPNSSPVPIGNEEWFLPPEGILDGTDFDIARRYIDGTRADLIHRTESPDESDEFRAHWSAVRLEAEVLLDDQERRLQAGDEELARLLAHVLEQQVDDLNKGQRTTIAGQAHLLRERASQVGHPYYVDRPPGPTTE